MAAVTPDGIGRNELPPRAQRSAASPTIALIIVRCPCHASALATKRIPRRPLWAFERSEDSPPGATALVGSVRGGGRQAGSAGWPRAWAHTSAMAFPRARHVGGSPASDPRRRSRSARLGSSPAVPLFLCHANCCRSVLACNLYEHLRRGASALSAGLAPGEQTSDRALTLLAWWGIDATEHRPRQLDRPLCDQASAIFVMAPAYLRRLLLEYGADLASKAYL